MTTVELPRIDRISAQARDVDVARVVLTVLAAVLWLVGAAPGALVRAVVWSAVAVRVGYRDGRGLSREPGGG